MAKQWIPILAVLVLTSTVAMAAEGKAAEQPETVEIHNGSVTLHALLWRPQGRGPFPTVLLNHGSGRTREELERLGPYERQAAILRPAVTRAGYVFFFPLALGPRPHARPSWKPAPVVRPAIPL